MYLFTLWVVCLAVIGDHIVKEIRRRVDADHISDIVVAPNDKGQRDNVKLIYNSIVTELKGANKLEAITIKNTETEETEQLNLDGIFVAIGQKPENEAFTNLTELNKWGYIEAAENCLTSTEGLFVAGDCRSKSVRQITTATADGAVAALAACRYIDNL